MFATLLDPRAFAATTAERIKLLARIGGPFLTDDPGEARAARSAGLQIGAVIDAPNGGISAQDVAAVLELTPEIVVVRSDALSEAPVGDEGASDMTDRQSQREQLAASLSLLKGAHRSAPHRMLLPVGRLAPASAAEWGSLPAESLVIDPIADPDAWRGAATWPGSRGLLLALVPPPGAERPEGAEVLLWAVGYAASLGGRGGDRVGVASSLRVVPGGVSSPIDQAEAEERMSLLAELVALTSVDAATRRARLDPRASSPAAAGRSESRAARGGVRSGE